MSLKFEHGQRVAGKAAPEGLLAQRELAGDPAFERGHKKARAVLESRKHRVSMREHIGRLTKEEVEDDIREADELRAKFHEKDTEYQKEAYRLAEIFEAILLEEGEESGWLGEGVKIQKTSDYDDIKNHVDLVAEWHGRHAHTLGLAVDVTFGASTLDGKCERLKDDIDKGRLGRMKYAHKEQTGIPRVIIGMSKETVKELMDLWLDEDLAALKNHPIQRVLLEQILSQLQTISAYARASGNEHMAGAYERSIMVVRNLSQSKMDIPLDSMQNDSVSQGINRQLTKRFTVQKH